MLWRCCLARASSNLRYAHSISSNKCLHSSLLPRHNPSYTSFFSNPNSNSNSKSNSNSNSDLIFQTFRFLSTNRNNNGDDDSNPPSWNLTSDKEEEGADSIFQDGGNLSGLVDDKGNIESKPTETSLGGGGDEDWKTEFDSNTSGEGDIFGGVESSKIGSGVVGAGDDEWKTAEGYTPWSFGDEEKNEVFDIGERIEGLPSMIDDYTEKENAEANRKLEEEKQQLMLKLKGPTRAFGDLIALSGMTDAMVDSLMLLKDLRGVEESPPQQSEQEKKRLAKHKVKIARSEIERKKQEEIDKSRVRRVDDKGRAYGTGRRKCSVARVFIQPGDGKFIINDKQFDAYFPVLDHRADLLRPFSETKTLGLWDVNCTVKGGGVSGQVGAIRLGISRALQNWEPGLRPSLKAVGFLRRDPRMVERKKPGKAKARKSYQWVKR